MDVEKKRFKKMFPHLAEEIEGGEAEVQVGSVRSDTETAGKAASGGPRAYDPDIIDFLRRCDSNEQAEEIISFLERKGEINSKYALRLRKQLREKGVRSFGPKKEDDYYLKQRGF